VPSLLQSDVTPDTDLLATPYVPTTLLTSPFIVLPGHQLSTAHSTSV